VKDYTINSHIRARFTRSLRDLADYLDQHPAVPVPAFGTTVTMYATPGDDSRAQVGRIAALLDTGICDETAHGGHYWAVRNFGLVGYEIVAITEQPSATDPIPVCYQSTAGADLAE
jgi:hypothetical protein